MSQNFHSNDIPLLQHLSINEYFKITPPSSWSFRGFRQFKENRVLKVDQARTNFNDALKSIISRKDMPASVKRWAGNLLDQRHDNSNTLPLAEGHTINICDNGQVGPVAIDFTNINERSPRQQPPAQKQKQQQQQPSTSQPPSPQPQQQQPQPQLQEQEEEEEEQVQALEQQSVGTPLEKSRANCGSIEEFKVNFQGMKNERKWLLKSGRYAEDVLYNIGLAQQKENICHSFTIDLSDATIQAAFDEEEWNELKATNTKEDIPLAQDIKVLLNDLNKTSTSEIREVIGEKLSVYLRMPYEVTFDRIQICYAALSLIMLYDMSPCPLLAPQLELWYECNVWTPLIDKIYGDVHSVQCVRGESANLSSKRRKAGDGSGNKGVKNDLIIRTIGSGHLLEFAAGETSCSYHDGVDTKHLYESSLKLPKSLRDMMMDLCRSADWNPDIVSKLEVIGYLHHGLVAQHVILDNPRGYVCRFTRLKKFEVPPLATDFRLALELFAMNLKLKKRAERSIATLRQQPLDLDFETVRSPASPTLPPTFTTPQRPQGKPRKRSAHELYSWY